MVLRILLALVNLEGVQVKVDHGLTRANLTSVIATPMVTERRSLRLMIPLRLGLAGLDGGVRRLILILKLCLCMALSLGLGGWIIAIVLRVASRSLIQMLVLRCRVGGARWL